MKREKQCFITEWNDHAPTGAQPGHKGLQPGARDHMSRLVQLGAATWHVHVYCMWVACMWSETLLPVSQSGRIRLMHFEASVQMWFFWRAAHSRNTDVRTVQSAVFSITQLTVSTTFCLQSTPLSIHCVPVIVAWFYYSVHISYIKICLWTIVCLT